MTHNVPTPSPDDSWNPMGAPWPPTGVFVEGCWSRDHRLSYGFVTLVRRSPDSTRTTWRDSEGAIVPFGPDFWKPA